MKLTIETDTANRMSIGVYDESGAGSGYRLAGRKFDGTGTPVVVATLNQRDADEIRACLDQVFPAAVPQSQVSEPVVPE